MRITRLSQQPPPPLLSSCTANESQRTLVDSNSSTLRPPNPTTTRTLLLLSRCLVFPFLAFAILLTLLPLLLPTTRHQGYTFFSIRPSEIERADGSLAINETSNINKSVDLVISGNTVSWLGINGPSIYVGAVQICSKIDPDEPVFCTSSSQAAYHAALLPLSLGDSLLALPSSPRSPILLLVSGIALLIASLVFTSELIPRGQFFNMRLWSSEPPVPLPTTPHRPFSQLRPALTKEDGESVRSLVEDQPKQTSKLLVKNTPHLAFYSLVLLALTLAASAMVQLSDVHRAKIAWNNKEGVKVGLVFKLGTLYYLLPILPVMHVLIILVAALPKISCLRNSPEAAQAPISRSEPHNDPVAAVAPMCNERSKEGSDLRPSLRDVDPPSPPHRPTTSTNTAIREQEGKKSWRASWRNTFGTIGIAV